MSADKCPVCGDGHFLDGKDWGHYSCGFDPVYQSGCDDGTRVAIERAAEIEKLRELGNALRHSCEQFGWTTAEHEHNRAAERIAAWNNFLASKEVRP